MPTYDYECGNCHKTFEKKLNLIDYTKEIDCDCGNKAKRSYSGNVSFDFRGQGTFKQGFDGYKR